MIAKTKEVLRKLEFGILEFFVGALMVIGLVGYFGNVPADLDWIDHTVSFVLFSYLFYKLNITSILFGKTSKFANAVIIVSYFSLFFKDIISYTKLDAFKFKVIAFVNYFHSYFRDNLFMANVATFYFGILGILAISMYIAKKIEISHPSFLHAIFQKKIRSNLVKFLLIFILLLGFYYFVYNAVLEWLEFTIDDPVVATGAIFYIVSIAKHHKKFHTGNFVFKIGDFSAKWYKRFVSLFHYKKTLPLAISGLLILHALTDLGVFAYSMTFLKKNFYLEHLGEGHQPFLKLFLEDAGNIPSYAAMPLFLDYLLNDLSLIIFLLIPIIVWARMFSQKELHLNRIFLFFIYSSAAAYALLPGYIIKPLSEGSIAGVDISSISLLKNKSALGNFFPNKSAIIVAVSLISIAFGLIVYILSSNSKIKRELYAISIIGGLTFYAVYLYYFFSSLALYLYSSIALVAFTPHFLIGLILGIFLALSIMFYIGGYLMFLYEIVMEYHKRKWSDPVDEELFAAIKKIKNIEKKMIKPKKSQIAGEVFKYALIGVFSVIVLVAGYKMVNIVKDRACNTEIAKFEIELRNIDKSLRFGARELQSYDVPCNADQIYFFDLNKNIKAENFKEIPLIKDTLESKGNNNVFLVKEGEVKRSFYAGNLEMAYPYYICFKPKFDKISFFIEGAGKTAKIAGACEQPECTYIPLDISEEDARRIVKESIDFGCAFCPKDFDKELDNLRLTRQNVEMFRKLTVCEGITNVEILIRPKKGAIAKNFRFYEFIPKTCIDDLSKYLAENVEGNVEIKGDPLLMWYFDKLDKEEKLSYKLSAELSDECMQAIQGLGVAEFVEGKKEEKEAAVANIAPNTAPTIQGLPDVTVSGLGLKRNAIANVWKYAQDKETNTINLVYTIIDQTNPNLVDCMINNEKHVDCEVKQNKEGASRVTLQVDDLEFTDRTSFNVKVLLSCKKHERKGCVGNQVYWFDSCSNQEELDI
ncbi:hypothetical protein HYX03_00825 [Candidatus Woesearchaeota archaeon]|nr:hypothetical protein [Candidatus Woesearchaeota archaeon]